MTLAERALDLAGLDAALVARLPAVRLRLLVLAALSLASSASIGVSAGYAAWLISSAVLPALLVGVGLGAGALNLLRAAAAGGGIAPHLDREQALRWRPSWLPVVVMALLASCLAQPALLAWHAPRLDGQIERYRAAQLRSRLVLDSSARPADVERRDRFGAALARESFAVQRVLRVWQDWPAASQGSLAFVLVCLLPLLAARWPFGSALHAYEIERYRRARRFIASERAATDHRVQRLLERWPTRPSPLPVGPP